MIRGVHTMFYSSEPEALRACLRDAFDLAATDIGDGWLIFDLPQGEMGVHPAMDQPGGAAGSHNISFYCDDIHSTLSELAARGVTATTGVTDAGYGLSTQLALPGGVVVELYQPHYRLGPGEGGSAAGSGT